MTPNKANAVWMAAYRAAIALSEARNDLEGVLAPAWIGLGHLGREQAEALHVAALKAGAKLSRSRSPFDLAGEAGLIIGFESMVGRVRISWQYSRPLNADDLLEARQNEDLDEKRQDPMP